MDFNSALMNSESLEKNYNIKSKTPTIKRISWKNCWDNKEIRRWILPWSPCVPCNTSNLWKITSRNSVELQTSDRLSYFGRSFVYILPRRNHKIQKSKSRETEELLLPNCISTTIATRRRRGEAKKFNWYSLDWKRNRPRTNWPKIVHCLNGKRKIPKKQKRHSENQWYIHVNNQADLSDLESVEIEPEIVQKSTTERPKRQICRPQRLIEQS